MKYIERNDCVKDNTFNYNEYLFYLCKILQYFILYNGIYLIGYILFRTMSIDDDNYERTLVSTNYYIFNTIT